MLLWRKMIKKKDKKLLQKIALEVQDEYHMGGLAEGLYLDFASDVALRFHRAKMRQK